jgi:hypothetical protein
MPSFLIEISGSPGLPIVNYVNLTIYASNANLDNYPLMKKNDRQARESGGWDEFFIYFLFLEIALYNFCFLKLNIINNSLNYLNKFLLLY